VSDTSKASSPRIGALILAAGESTRTADLGSPKQLLRFGTRTLLDHAVSNLGMSEIERSVLVLGAHADKIQAELWLDEAEIVVNADWQLGMISSVQAGLRALGDRFDWVLILPCDYALIERTTIATLLLRAYAEPQLARADKREPAPLIAPSFYGKSGHPILLNAELCKAALALDTGVGLDAVVQAYKPQRALVEVDDPAIHFDVDTPDDYQRALNAWRMRSESREAYLKAMAR